jgi:alkylhydroperoxidase family enzyme
MRLDVLHGGHPLRTRAFFALTRRVSGVEMSDVPKTLLYRPDFFGGPLLELSAEVMRGPSFWTAGEREYLAMRIAERNRCAYCAVTHAELVRIAADGEIAPDQPETARAELAAAVGLAEKVTATPDAIGPADMAPVAAAGVPEAGIRSVLYLTFMWNVVNRVASAFGFELLDGQLHSGTRSLHRFGYRFPALLTGGRPRYQAAEGDPYAGPVAALRAAVLHAPGVTDPAIRAAAAAGDRLPDSWGAYATTVRDASDSLSADDTGTLRASGHSEDAIFEVTVAAAVGAAARGLDAGLRALSGQE